MSNFIKARSDAFENQTTEERKVNQKIILFVVSIVVLISTVFLAARNNVKFPVVNAGSKYDSGQTQIIIRDRLLLHEESLDQKYAAVKVPIAVTNNVDQFDRIRLHEEKLDQKYTNENVPVAVIGNGDRFDRVRLHEEMLDQKFSSTESATSNVDRFDRIRHHEEILDQKYGR